MSFPFQSFIMKAGNTVWKEDHMRFSGFADLLEKQADRHGRAHAFIYQSEIKQIVSYEEFRSDVLARSEELKKTEKTCMGILTELSYPCIREIFAANIAGMQVVMLNKMLPAETLGELIRYTDTDILFGSDQQKEALSQYLTEGTAEGRGKILFFTSGTTASSKAVVLSDEKLMSSAWNGSSMLPLSKEDRLLCVLPLDHVFGFVCCLLWPLQCGASVAVGRGPRHYMDDCMYFRPTVISVVPMLLSFLLQQQLINPEMKLILVGAGDCPKEILGAASAKGLRVSYGYGLTETSSGVAISVEGDPSAMAVCPDDEITIAEDGEICIKAPTCMMEGYYKDPEMTAGVLRDGILYTGDLGYLDEEGKLHITGRKKEILVLHDGTKIFLPEYETKILHAARIREAAAVLKNGKPVLIVYAPQLSAEQISERLIPLMKTLPRGHQITEIIMRDTPLPRTATGKIRRWELQKETEEL